MSFGYVELIAGHSYCILKSMNGMFIRLGEEVRAKDVEGLLNDNTCINFVHEDKNNIKSIFNGEGCCN